MITGANLNAVIAVFTIVIAGTTIAYTLVTWRLLTQSRWAFLVDTLIRIIERTEDRTEQYYDPIRKSIQERASTRLFDDEIQRGIGLAIKWDTEPYLKGLSEAVKDINKKLGIDLHKVFLDYKKEATKVRKDTLSELHSVKREFEKKTENREKT